MGRRIPLRLSPPGAGKVFGMGRVRLPLRWHCHRFSRMRPHGVILVATKEETRTKARGLVAAARATGSLTPTEAGSLFGKPRLVLCLGRVGLAPLHAIKRRQYASNTGHDWPLECALGEALDCILDLLYAPPFPAVLLCKSSGRRPVLVWSDAMWDPSTGLPFGTGQVGFVVKIPRDPPRRRWLRRCVCGVKSFPSRACAASRAASTENIHPRTRAHRHPRAVLLFRAPSRLP